MNLFGNDDARLPAGFLRPQAAPVALDLLDYAARLSALASGRALAQERADLLAPGGNGDDTPLFAAHGAPTT